ncbi:MAG: ubiquinone/menaquinone biosynthesis methyltransferase [Planctomycetes bacterium]|nr:ubiquinone/menaquinone biosynthesis methyltransferase [Planctomycetota bacterium]
MAEAVKHMFGRIAPKYDMLNRVLSARRDVAWRRTALGMLTGSPSDVLDLACGTFDLALEALACGKARRIHGCDFCQPMLIAGASKRSGRPVTAAVGDALRLPYADASFDAAMVAYGWRNFGDPARSLAELRRVLRPGGEVLILEFFRPERWWPRVFYATFGRFVFPAVGGLLAGDSSAYRYLNDSIRGFLSIAEAERTMAAAGFDDIRRTGFFGGVSHALVGRSRR